jgi:hypothetical protein
MWKEKPWLFEIAFRYLIGGAEVDDVLCTLRKGSRSSARDLSQGHHDYEVRELTTRQ